MLLTSFYHSISKFANGAHFYGLRLKGRPYRFDPPLDRVIAVASLEIRGKNRSKKLAKVMDGAD